MTNQQFLLLLSIPTGFLAGLAAIVIKKLAHWIRDLVLMGVRAESYHFLYFVFPFTKKKRQLRLATVFLFVCL